MVGGYLRRLRSKSKQAKDEMPWATWRQEIQNKLLQEMNCKQNMLTASAVYQCYGSARGCHWIMEAPSH